MNKFDRKFWIPYLILLILILIRLIPFLYPESQTWGFNHLIFLPVPYSFAFIGLAIIALVLPFWKKTEFLGESFANWFVALFFVSDRKYYYRVLFAVCLTILFVLFSTGTYYLGDGYGYLKILGSSDRVLEKWSEVGASELMSFIQSLLGVKSDQTALLSFQIVSYISGFAFVLLLFSISKLVSDSSVTRLLTFCLSILSGILLLFFGYVEYYPLVWVLMAAYLYFALRFLKTGVGLTFVWLFQLLGILFHLQLAIFFPGTLYLTFCSGKGRQLYNSYKKILWFLIGVGIFGIIAIAYHKYTTDLYFQDIFLPLFFGKPIDPYYAIFSLSHIIDILNEFILISPLLLMLIFFGTKQFKTIWSNITARFLGLLTICGMFFILIIDPKLALPRDWDLLSFVLFPILLLFIIFLKEPEINKIRKFVLSMIVFAFISTIPVLLLFLNNDRSLKYTEYIISLHPQKSYGSLVVLNEYYDSIENKVKSESLKAAFNSKHSRINQLNLAMNAMDDGNLKLAETIIGSIKPDKYDGDYQRIWGRYYYMQGNYVKALEYLDRAVQLRAYNSLYYWQRAMIYAGLSKNDKALDDLKNAYDLDNSSMRVLDGLSYMYFSSKQYDSSIYYAKEMVRIDPSQMGAYYMLANSYYNLKNYEAARQNAEYFIEKTEGTSIYNNQREQLLNMIDQIDNGLKKP